MKFFNRSMVLLLLSSLIFSCAKYSKEKIVVNSTTVKQTQTQVLVNQATIIDVRTPEEYKISHIEGAININISSETFAKEVSQLNKVQTYILHCSANVPNGRTEKALNVMDGLGFDTIFSMQGGIVEWEKQKLPLVKLDLKSKVQSSH